MVFSKIIDNGIAYYCLHAEQSLQGAKEYADLHISTLTKTTIEELCSDIIQDKCGKVYILDFDNIEHIAENIFQRELLKILTIQQKLIIFTNIKKSVVDKIQVISQFKYRFGNKRYLDENEHRYDIFYLGEPNGYIPQKAEQVFSKKFAEKLLEYKFEKDDGNRIEQLSSSVYLTSYINIKKLMSYEKNFMLFAIYLLAMKVKKHWLNEEKINLEKPVLICQSLNGSYIASVLSSLLNLDLYIFDQVGPVNKLYQNVGSQIQAGRNYIIVSDVVCLGTEVKIAKSIIEYLGGIYLGNVSIVRTRSIKEFKNAEAVFLINKDNYKILNYKIIAPFEEL